MDANHGDVTLETLLQHRDWVRRLARALSRDEASADDVEQTAWMTAMKSPPRHAGNLRAWLAALVRTTARSIARGDERRTHRERATAREPHVSPHDTLERAELSRRLVEIVMTLREPYRTAVVLAYFDDLSPAEVAERTGVPATTARGRIHRGLGLVREELDRDHDGRRGAWLVALVPLAGEGSRGSIGSAATASGVLGGLVMSTKTKIAAGIVLALLVGVFVWKRDPALEPATSVAIAPASAPLAAKATPAVLGTAPSVDRATIATIPPPASAASTTLDVQVIWERDGAPGADLEVVLVRRDAAYRRFSRSGSTDAGGRCRFEAVAPGATNVYVDRGGRERLEIEPDAQASVLLRIPDGPRVTGRVVSLEGAPIDSAQVRVSWAAQDPAKSSLAALTDADGRFDLGTVRSGHYVSARAPGHAPSHAYVIPDDGPVELVLSLLGEVGSLAGRVVDRTGALVAGANVAVGEERAWQVTFPDGAQGSVPPAASLVTASDGSFRVEGLALGSTPIVVRAAGYAPTAARADIGKSVATAVEIVLSSGGTLRGVVRDGTGALVPGVDVHVEDRKHFAYAKRRTDDRGAYEIDHLPAGDFAVVARGEQRGQARGRVEIVDGSVTEWNADLDCEPSIAGLVLDAQGAPLANAFVSARVAEIGLDQEQLASLQRHELEATSLRTDADGRFRWCSLPDLPL